MSYIERRIRKLEYGLATAIAPPIILDIGSGPEFDRQVTEAKATIGCIDCLPDDGRHLHYLRYRARV